jgi:glycosyltransferase involved in cell wall biosynthesis
MVVYYLHHYATPPSAGIVGRPHALASEFRRLGHRIIVVYASDHHLRSVPAAAELVGSITVEEGVEYLILPVRPYKGNGIKRLQNIFDYCKKVKSLKILIRQSKLPKPDIIIASSAPLFVYPAARSLAQDVGVPHIFEVRDIWPLSLVEIAGVSRWHPIVIWMGLIERVAYHQADAIVSLLPNALEHMRHLGLSADRFFFIPNGISLDVWGETPIALPDQHEAVFRRLRKEGKLIVVYSGSHGPPNALEQILDLKQVIGADEPPYHFVMIGDGISKLGLMAKAEAEQCSYIDFLPRVTKAESIAAIWRADVCFIGWQDKPIYRFGISPNKISEYMYAQKPVIHAVPESNDPVREARAGISVKPFDPGALDAALRTLCGMSPEQRDEMGKNGRRYVLENLEWSILARQYELILQMLLTVR